MPQYLAAVTPGPIEYRLEGAGPVVMVLNGGHCTRESRLSHERLTNEGFTVLTPSRPGYDATPPGAGRTAPQAADALAQLLDTLQIPSVDLIAISAAGPTGLALAQRHRHKLRKLILESAVTLPWDRATRRGARLAFGRAERLTWALLKLALRWAPLAVMRVMLQALTTLDVNAVLRRMSPEDLDFVRRMLNTSRSGTGFVQDVEHQVTDLHLIQTPVLVMYSPHDRAVPPRHAQRIAAEVAQAELYEVPSDTHLIWIGPAAQSVWQKRLAFLNS